MTGIKTQDAAGAETMIKCMVPWLLDGATAGSMQFAASDPDDHASAGEMSSL